MSLVLFIGVGSKAKNYSKVTTHFLTQLQSLPPRTALVLLNNLAVNTKGERAELDILQDPDRCWANSSKMRCQNHIKSFISGVLP